MTLYPCPVCGQEPVVDVLRGGLSCACRCHREYGRDLAELERAWNGLYCSNDPATVEDCIREDDDDAQVRQVRPARRERPAPHRDVRDVLLSVPRLRQEVQPADDGPRPRGGIL